VTGWTEVLTAISTTIIALAVVAFSVAVIALTRRLTDLSRNVERLLDTMDRDARPALEAVRRTADEASRVAILVRDEAEGIVGTSKTVRGRIERTAASLEDRFIELETLVGLLQNEVEETVLDVAAALRMTRRGSGLLRRIKRALAR